MTETIQDRYEVRQVVGQGGLGTVYRGWDLQLNRAVAIKRLHSTTGYRDVESEAYLEARALASLQHPNVVTLHDFGIDEQGAYFIMEFLEGENLDARIPRAVLAVEEWSELSKQTLEGLSAAHSAGIIHRDLKPSNLMLIPSQSRALTVKILDFGMARVQQEPREQTSGADGSLIGSIFYMAPEQFSRSPLDARTDLYALGYLLYHALAGVTAFKGESIAELIGAHMKEQPYEITAYRPDLSNEASLWLHRLMQKEPEQRPSSAQEALAEFPDGQVEALEPERPAALPPRVNTERPTFHLEDIGAVPKKSNNGIWWGMIGALAALVVGAGVYFLTGHEENANRSALNITNTPAVAEADSVISVQNTPVPAVVETGPPKPIERFDPEPSGSISIEQAIETFDPEQLARLKAMLGKEVMIEGVPVGVSENRSGSIRYLNFTEDYKASISLVFFISDSPEEFTEEKLSRYAGKLITVTGRVDEYRGDLQLKVKNSSQIKIRR